MPNPASALRNLDTVVQQPAVEDGYVSTVQPAPVAFTDKLYVIVPEHSTTVPLGPCEWGAIHGSALPKQGARCQVACGGEELPRVVWWEGAQREIGPFYPEDANHNIAIGSTFSLLTTGQSNSAFGFQALNDVTTGSKNTAIGRAALEKNT